MKQFIETLKNNYFLDRDQACQAMSQLLDPKQDAELISEFLLAANSRLPSSTELSGYLDFLSQQSNKCSLQSQQHFDLCGTGGDGKNTINISTISAFLLAAMGEVVAKHGNYAASSTVGSSNLLEALNIPLLAKPDQASRCFDTFGIVFLHAPHWHPALKGIAPIRKALGVRTIFNLMGPLLNPTKPAFQITGAPALELAKLLAETQALRSAESFMSLADHNGYDEISLTGSCSAFRVLNRQNNPISSDTLIDQIVEPANFGIDPVLPEEIQAPASLEQIVANTISILAGNGTRAQQNVICANVAFALSLKYQDQELKNLFDRAQKTLSAGKALELLKKLRAYQ